MRFICYAAAVFGLIFGFAALPLFGEEPGAGSGAEAVPFEVFGYPYFVKNTVSPPEGESALALVLGSPESFSGTFGVGYRVCRVGTDAVGIHGPFGGQDRKRGRL